MACHMCVFMITLIFSIFKRGLLVLLNIRLFLRPDLGPVPQGSDMKGSTVRALKAVSSDHIKHRGVVCCDHNPKPPSGEIESR